MNDRTDRMARVWQWLTSHGRHEPVKPAGAAHTIMVGAIITAAAAALLGTAVGFWLSYANLHTIAVRAGLPPVEAWAFPASIDLFIVVGEMGILVSALRHTRDLMAWVYLLCGFAPSVVFNVLSVTSLAWWEPYVIRGTAPAAAMLALAAFIRQVFRLAADAAQPETVPAAVPVAVPAQMNGDGKLPAFTEIQDRQGCSKETAKKIRAELRRDRAARAVPAGHVREDVTA